VWDCLFKNAGKESSAILTIFKPCPADCVNALRRDVREAVKPQLNQGKSGKLARAARVGGMVMLEALLSQSDCKAAFAKHLNEEQLQDYLDFTKACRQRERRAVNRQLIAGLDRQLSLTVEQRQQVEQLLGAKKGDRWRPTSMEMLNIDAQESVNTLHRLKVPVDEILSKSQSEIWQLLVTPHKTEHPLYQQTIKDVLSEDAFAQYKARQAERQAFRLQAGHDLVVASLDSILLLDENQRQHFEATAAKLPAPPASDRVPAPVRMFTQLSEQTDSEILSPWQQERLGEYARRFRGWFDEDDNDARRRRR